MYFKVRNRENSYGIVDQSGRMKQYKKQKKKNRKTKEQ